MKKWISVTVVLFIYAMILSSLPSSSQHLPAPQEEQQGSDNFFVLNAPLVIVHYQDGVEIKAAHESFFFGGTAAEFAAVGLDTTDLKLVDAIKASGGDTNLDISTDRKNAHLKNGQTVYYGVKILPASRGEVTGVTFVLTTVPISGVPDIVNNYFKIKYVEAVGGRAGDVKNDSTSGKAYQVITPAGEHLYYFSFTAVVCSGGIRTKIEPHFFGGAIVRDVAQDYIQCCCAHTKKPLPRVPEITCCWWYGFSYIGDWFTYWFKVCLAKAVATNTANVPCDHQTEAQGKEITITGDGFSRLNKTKEELAGLIKITDDCGTVAAVTEVTSLTNTEIKAKIDITACRPGTKTVKIEGAGGFATTTFIKVVQDVPDTIVCQKRFQAVRIIGTQEKLPLTVTINDGTNVTFATGQSFNVSCVTRGSATSATTTTTGGCNNIATTTIQGTAVSGEDTMIVSGNGIRCEAPIRNADITLVAVPEGKKALVCVGEMQEVKVTIKSPSTYYSAVTLTTSSADVIKIWADPAKTTQIPFGEPIFTNPVPTAVGSMEAERTLWIEGLKPGTVCLTATYCDKTRSKCDSIALTVMELLTLKATDKANTGNVVEDTTDGTEVTPRISLYADANGKAQVTLAVTTDPATEDVLQRVKYTVEGATASPPAGAFDPAKPTVITLTPTDGNRTYTITAWLDCDNDGNRDPEETTRVVEATVIALEKLRVADSGNPDFYREDTTSTGPDPVLYYCNQASVKVKLSVAMLPPDAEKAKTLWIVEGNTATPLKGNFATDPEVTLTPADDASRKFTVKAGCDRNGNDMLDPDEITRAVAVVLEKVELMIPPYIGVGATVDASLTIAAGDTRGKWMIGYTATEMTVKRNGVVVTPGRLSETITSPQTIAFQITILKAGTWTITATFVPEGEEQGCASAKTTEGVKIDVDIDSDNDNYKESPFQGPPDRSVGENSEEEIEDDARFLGKVMGVNDNDDDHDGVRDDVDGFNQDGAIGGANGRDDINTSERDFIPVVLEIPAPVNLAKAMIQISFEEGERMRLWTKRGNDARNIQPVKSGGDRIEAGEYKKMEDLALLGFSADKRWVTLYVEGLRPSSGRGRGRIIVALDPDGFDGPVGYITNDAVRLTIVRPDVDVDTDHSGTIAETDDPNEYTMGYHTWRGDGGIGASRPFDFNIEPDPSVLFTGTAPPLYVELIMTECPIGGEARVYRKDGGIEPILFDAVGDKWRYSGAQTSIWSDNDWEIRFGTLGPTVIVVPGVYRFQFRIAIDGGFSIADEVTIRVIELQTYFTMQITEAQGLYKPDSIGIGKYNAGYTSDDDKGRIYTNRIYDVSDPSKTIWTKNKQYVDLTVRIGPPDAPIPQGAVIVWSSEDPDDPSNEDPLTHQEAGDTLDPNDYDASGSYLGQKNNDNSGSRDGAVQWEQVPGSVYTLSNGNETAIVNRESKMRFNVTDDAGDNFRVTARIKFESEGILGNSDSTGMLTVWHKVDVEYVKMASAAPLTGLLDGTANNAYAKAFNEFEVGLQRNVPDIVVDGMKQMGVNDAAAYKKCKEYVTKANGEFSKEGEKGWFFAAAANYYLDTSGAGAAPVLYSGTATLQADGLTFQLPQGAALSDTDKKMTGNKTSSLAPSAGYRVMKTDMVFNFADEFKDGTIYYAGGVEAVIISHTQGSPGGGNGAEITYDATADAPNGPVRVEKIVVELVRVYKPGDPTESISFRSDELTWNPTARTFKVREKDYSTPLVSGAYSFDAIDHGFTAGATLDIRVVGVGALTTDGISPGLKGRVIVFTASGGDLSTIDHEFGHGLGFEHICGNWDYRSNDSTGNACAMHYTWYWMLTTATPRRPDPWLLGNDGPYFCEEHIRAMREQNLEDYLRLGW